MYRLQCYIDAILKSEQLSDDELQKVNEFKDVLIKETFRLLQLSFSKDVTKCKESLDICAIPEFY